jgi:VIT1/CCC1 family predicted Fe2+/Mn2+ transporter
MEVAQLREMFEDMGVTGDDLDASVLAFSRDDAVLLNAMKALEFGVIDSERRSPYKAMFASSMLFVVGSLSSVAPFLFTGDTNLGLLWAAALTAVGLFAVGTVKAMVSKGNRIRSGLENLTIAGLGGVVAWWVGRLVESSLA